MASTRMPCSEKASKRSWGYGRRPLLPLVGAAAAQPPRLG
uniref:Uncharacterized protein n=1 Tax=Arundo donax TaxID=35708 RepID=A0A0A9CE73_ARUDO